ncbi:MAG: hypothetical protein LBK60_06330 [Verrucomicrobiales bacterium]|jgi:hypothetical protein|nr:hypothetical protein [Verrucomicrobiales bacterium]
MADQIIPIEQLDAQITAILLRVKKGVFDAARNGQIVCTLPKKVDFQIKVVGVVNGIDRVSVTDSASERESNGESNGESNSESKGTVERDESSDNTVDKITTQTESAQTVKETNTPNVTQVTQQNTNGSNVTTTNYTHEDYNI